MVLKGLLGLEPCQNTWTINTPAADNTFAEAEEIRDLVQTNGWVDAWLDCCPAEYTLQEIEVRGIVVIDGGSIATPAAVDAFIASNGSRAGGIVSGQDGPMVSYFPEIVVGERARVNKTFIPGLAVADAISDVIQTVLLGKMDDFLDAIDLGLILASGTGDFALIISRLLDITLPFDEDTNPIVKFLRPIMATGVEFFVASQNGRRSKSD
jgi:hypothetical protein